MTDHVGRARQPERLDHVPAVECEVEHVVELRLGRLLAEPGPLRRVHGESLGENSFYLHGMPFRIAPDVQKHVPWVSWLSPAFQQRTGITMECLRTRAGERVTHDALFHSVLGLMHVSTSLYRRALDPYGGCAPAVAAVP